MQTIKENKPCGKPFPMQIDIYLLTDEARRLFYHELADVAHELRERGYSVWDDYSHHRYQMHQSTRLDDMDERKRLIEASKCVVLYDYYHNLTPAVIHDLGMAVSMQKPIIVMGQINGVCMGVSSTIEKKLPWVTVENWEKMMKRIVSICGKRAPLSGVKRIKWRSTLQHPDDLVPTASKKTGLWGYCDKEGRTRCSFKYQLAHGFSDGMARVKTGDRYGYLGDGMRMAIEPQYDRAGDFNCGLAPAAVKVGSDYRWGYIDKENKVVVPHRFYHAWRFEDCGLAMVNADRKYGIINTSGELVLSLDYGLIDIEGICEEKPGMVFKDGLCGFVNTRGEVIIPPQYDESFGFSEGVAACKKNNEWFLIDTGGTRLADLQYSQAYRFSEGLLPVAINETFTDEKTGEETIYERWGFCDRQGDEVIPCEYDDVLPFSEGYAAVCFHGKWGYIDHENRVMIPFQYDSVSDDSAFGRMADGIAKVGIGVQGGNDRCDFFEINKLGQVFLSDSTLCQMPIHERGLMANREIYPVEYPLEAGRLREAGICPKDYYLANIMASLMKNRLSKHPEENPFKPERRRFRR